jgi:hypothetical protein
MGATWHVRGKTPGIQGRTTARKNHRKKTIISLSISSVQFSSVQFSSNGVPRRLSLPDPSPAQAIGRARHGHGTHVAVNKRVCEWHQFQGLNVVIYSQYRQNFRASCGGLKTRARGTLIISSTGRSAGAASDDETPPASCTCTRLGGGA